MSITCKTLKMGENLIDTVNQRLGGWPIFQDYALKSNCTVFTIDTTKVRSLYITKLDSVQRIVSGKFQFRAYNNCGDILIFDGGRFELNFNFSLNS